MILMSKIRLVLAGVIWLFWVALAGAQSVTFAVPDMSDANTQSNADKKAFINRNISQPVQLNPSGRLAFGRPRLGILVLNVDEAYAASAWGQRAQADLEAAAREIETENSRLEAQMTKEERALTEERTKLSSDKFRQKAEAFDQHAQAVRRERKQAAVDLGNRAQADRNAFLNAAVPVIAGLMEEQNAGIVLDRRQTLVAIDAVDITTELVERMDETVGDGGSLPEIQSVQPDNAGLDEVLSDKNFLLSEEKTE